MASLDVDVLKEVFTHLILNDPKDFVRSNNVLIPMERKYRLYLVNRQCYVTMLSLLQEFHIAEVGHNNNQDLVENVASLVNYDIFLWKLDRHGNLGYCFGIDTRLFLYFVRHNLTGCNTLYFDFSYRMAPLRMDVLLFGHLGIKLDKDIFNVYESLARSRRNSLSKIMRTLQNIRGIQKLYFTGSILNFLPEIQKILKNNIYTLQEIKNVPAELFHDPIEGLYFLPREISALAAKSLCFWTPDLNLQMILHEIQEFTVTLTATTSICATMSLNTVSTTMSDSKQMLTNTTDQENTKPKPLQPSQSLNQCNPAQVPPEEPSYTKKLVPFTSTKALEFHIKAFTNSSSKKNLHCKWEGCNRKIIFGGEFMLNMHMKRRHIVEKQHFYEMQKSIEI